MTIMHENLMAKVLDNLKAWTILKRNTLHKGDPKLCAHNHIPYARHYNPRFVYFLPTF